MFYPSLSGGWSAYGAASDAAASASSAATDAREAKAATESMQHDIDRLLMITEALWGFLKQQHGYSDEDLVQAIKEIDMRDGMLDGRAKRGPVTCPACGRANSGKRPMCIYCGKAVPASPFAR
jgi:hypothetical protein